MTPETHLMGVESRAMHLKEPPADSEAFLFSTFMTPRRVS